MTSVAKGVGCEGALSHVGAGRVSAGSLACALLCLDAFPTEARFAGSL